MLSSYVVDIQNLVFFKTSYQSLVFFKHTIFDLALFNSRKLKTFAIKQ